jgi:hypothetical protein
MYRRPRHGDRRTDQQGTIELTSDGSGWSVRAAGKRR